MVAALAASSILIASAVTRASRDDAASATVQAQLGDLLFNDGRFRDASEAYERAFGLAPAPLKTHVGQQWVKSLMRSRRVPACARGRGRRRRGRAGRPRGDGPRSRRDVGRRAVRRRRKRATARPWRWPRRCRVRGTGVARALLSRSQLDAGLPRRWPPSMPHPEEADLYPTLVHAYQRSTAVRRTRPPRSGGLHQPAALQGLERRRRCGRGSRSASCARSGTASPLQESRSSAGQAAPRPVPHRAGEDHRQRAASTGRGTSTSCSTRARR